MGFAARLAVRMMPILPRFIVRRVARPYVAGEALADAIETVRTLNDEGAKATMAVLGEEVRDSAEARKAADEYVELLRGIKTENVASSISVKPSNLGARIGHDVLFQNMDRVVGKAVELGNFVRLDMEDHTLTDVTLDLYREMQETHGNTGIVFQAMLHRTLGDIEELPNNANARLCKGIYLEPEDIAWRDRDEIRTAYVNALDRLFARGAYVGIATHDQYLIDEAKRLIDKHGIARDGYEFQMLLGVLPGLRKSLIAEGHPMRVYVPHGRLWYAYSKRRLRENPDIAGHIIRGLFRRRR